MQTILVTGASGGIGSAIMEALSALPHIQIIAVDKENRAQTGGGIIFENADISSHQPIEKLRDKTTKQFPKIDWLVASHGFIDTETNLEKERHEDIEATFSINTLSVIYLTQLFLPHFKADGGIIALSSTAGLKGNGRYAAYSASKAAVNNFMQAMARNRPELNFITICPGPTSTPMREKIAGDAATKQNPSAIAQTVLGIVLGKTDYKSGDIIVVRDGQEELVSRLDS